MKIVKTSKLQHLTNFSIKYFKTHNKFLIEKLVNQYHFLITEKNCKSLGLKGDVYLR